MAHRVTSRALRNILDQTRSVGGEERRHSGVAAAALDVLPGRDDRQDVVALVYLCGFAVNVVAQCVEQK
jgi:hypothetical protein